MPDNTGHVIQVTGPVVDVQFVGGSRRSIRHCEGWWEGQHNEVPEQAFHMNGQN